MTRAGRRVAFVTERARSHDGWGRYAVGLVREMRPLGIEPVLVTSDPALEAALSGLEHHPILPPLFRRRFELLRSLRSALALRRLFDTCDAVHVLAEPYLPVVAASVPASVPLVHTAHGTWSLEPLRTILRRCVQAVSLERVDLVVFQSRFTRERMRLRVPLPPHVVWPGGVRLEDFDATASTTLPAWYADGPLVPSVGAMKERKGHHVALEAVARACESVPGLRWVVVGGDVAPNTYRDSLVARASVLGVSDRIRFLGHVSQGELAALYRRADVFLLLPVSSGDRIEGLGLVYLEAAAAGTPSIGSLDTGAAEAIADGETGLLVPQRDAVASAAALVRLLTDRRERVRLGQGAGRRASQLSWSRLGARLAQAYAGLQGRAPWHPREDA